MRSTAIVLALALTLSGCIQTIAIRTVGGIMEHGFAAFNEEADLGIAREGLSGNLKLLEALIKGDPKNEKLLLFAAQGYSAYALAFVEDDSVERARPLYLRAREYAFRILEQKMDLRAALAGDLEELRLAVDRLSDDDVPAVFWAAFSWGAFINISRTDLTAMGDLSKVDVLMAFVHKRQPSYYYGGSDAYFGSIQGTIPAVLGGRPDLSKSHFEKAMSYSQGRFLIVQVMFAKTYCVQVQDRELFEKLLSGVLEASLDDMPEARLPNAMAKKKAERLLAEIDELF
ncbi:MAG: TRAP transporter TatT component family protein [Bacteroidetes bacterium]|jgi:hypothetical protein|nr:TRAP transporter TatT component family protein [Bacteroidota bacterium]